MHLPQLGHQPFYLHIQRTFGRSRTSRRSDEEVSRPCGVVVLPSSVVEMNLSALADGQILTILSYLVDYNIYEHYDKKQKIEQDRFERRFKRLFPHSHIPMPKC